MGLLHNTASLGAYLRGERFSTSTGLDVRRADIPDRLTYLAEAVRDKNVLHVGFGDHLEVLDAKRRDDLWLHDRLCRTARRCVGIDIDESVVAAARDRNVDDVYVFDLNHPDPGHPVLSQRFDVVVLGEVLEHIDNPVEFLGGVQSLFGDGETELIVTVPNAWNVISPELCLAQSGGNQHRPPLLVHAVHPCQSDDRSRTAAARGITGTGLAQMSAPSSQGCFPTGGRRSAIGIRCRISRRW